MNKIIVEDFEKLLSAYEEKFENLRGRTILVTGATGMIAAYLSEFLIYIADSYNIQLYLQCRSAEKGKKIFEKYLDKNNVHLVNFNFENNEIPDIQFDYILHAASPASTAAFEKTPVDVISPNVIGTWYLLQHARKNGIRNFLMFSAGSVYGQSETEKSSISEKDYGVVDPLWYRSCYVESKRLAEQMGMELEVHKVGWDSIGISMDSGEYDCIIAGMGRTAERMLSYSFTEPYYYRSNCVVVKKGSEIENITGLSDLAGKNITVTTQLGTGWVPLLDQIPDAVKGANYETTAEVFMAISNGTADLAVIDLPTAQSALLTNDDLKIITLDDGDTFVGDEEMTNVCIATRKDDTEFRDKLQAAMDEVGLDRDTMNSMMEEAISVQPAAN